MPVEFAEITGYQVADDDVLSVITILLALVAVVAVVALPALPSIDTPVNVCVALALFSAIDVVPTKRLELPKTVDGIVPDNCPADKLVKLAPEPLNPVAVKIPVEGLYCSFVDEVYSVVRLPAV